MDDDNDLTQIGISENFAFGLVFLTILVALVTIFTAFEVYEAFFEFGIGFRLMPTIISLFVCIFLLIYTYYTFNTDRISEKYFIAAIILYIIQKFFGALTYLINYNNPFGFIKVITFFAAIYFLYSYKKRYRTAQYAMLAIVVLELITELSNMYILGTDWFVTFKLVIIPCTIALTHYGTVLKDKYLKNK